MIAGLVNIGDEDHSFEAYVIEGFILIGPFAALIGAIIGSFSKGSKIFQIEGMTDSEIQKTLDKLRKKARIRNYK